MITVRHLHWDLWNIMHIARHAVSPDEVEAVCHGPCIMQQANQGRLMLIGPTEVERMLAVVLEPEGAGVYYPITARPASRKERQLYQDETRGEME